MKLAVITGASAGIGEALARKFAASGYHLALIARRIERLQTLADELQGAHGIKCDCIEADLSDAASVDKIVTALGGRRIHVLVNNAGVMLPGRFCQSEPEALSSMLNVNVVTLVLLTRRLIPTMIDNGEGRVLIVSSMAAFLPIPRDSVYAATKAFSASLSQALAMEFRDRGVSVTLLCPGLTDTAMVSHTLTEDRGVMAMIKRSILASAEQVAEAGYAGCMKRKAVVVPGAVNRFFASVYQLMPWFLSRQVGATVGRYFV